MARYNDVLLAQTAVTGLGGRGVMVNPAAGGQNGFQQDLKRWHGATPQTRRPVFAKLMEGPTALNLLPNGQYYMDLIKGMVELDARTWDGLNSTLTVNVADTPLGGGGEIFQAPVGTARNRSEPAVTLDEKYGYVYKNLLDFWIRYLIGDPITGHPNIIHLAGITLPSDWLHDKFTMSVLFFEPDVLMKTVNNAWLVSNMMPQSSGDVIGKRDRTTDREIPQYSITFTGFQQTGDSIMELAQLELDKMRIVNTSPSLAPAHVKEVEASVRRGEFGIAEKQAEAAATYLRPSV